MGLFGFGKKEILECTCGCRCKDSFEKYGFITKQKKEYDYRRYGKTWHGDYYICIDCNEGKHSKGSVSHNSSKKYNVTVPFNEFHIKTEKLQGILKGISDDEFLIFLKLGFMKKGLSISKIRRKIISANDIVLTLTGKNIDFSDNVESLYVAYVDRTPNEYSTTWIDDFLIKANESESHFGHCKQILIMNTTKNLIDYKMPKKSNTANNRNQVKLFLGKKFIDYFFKGSHNSFMELKKLYPNENELWDKKSQDEQSDYCEQINIDYIQYHRLWKYPLFDQCRLIFALGNTGKESKQEKNTSSNDAYENDFGDQSEMSLDHAFKILGLDATATSEEIKKSFKSLSLKWHHDRQPLNSKRQQLAVDIMKEINNAYQYLESEGKV